MVAIGSTWFKALSEDSGACAFRHSELAFSTLFNGTPNGIEYLVLCSEQVISGSKGSWHCVLSVLNVSSAVVGAAAFKFTKPEQLSY